MPVPPHSLIGRTAELAAIDEFVDSVSQGPAALLLEGEVGIGKTTLFRAGVAAAGDRGARVLVGRPIQSEAQLAYAALGDLLGAIPEAVLDELPPPQRKAVEIALLRTEPDDEQQLLPRAVALGALGALRLLSNDAPTIIAIDDVQWLDAPSEHALAFVARRLVDEPIGILAARRTDAVGDGSLFGLGSDSVFTGERVRHVAIAPLGISELDALLQERLGRPMPRRVVAQLHEMSAGNAFFALEIARSGLDGLRATGPAGSIAVPPSLQELLGDRLTALPAHAREATNIAAALSRATVPIIEAAMEGGDRAAGIAAAIDAGVLDLVQDRVAFTHPLLQSIAYAQIPPTERRRLHARLAVLLFDPEERGRHVGLSAEEPSDLVALSLDWAARRARARGAPDAAAELLEQARRLTPESSFADRHRRGIGAAERYFEAGNTARADALLEELIAEAPPGRDRALALARLGWVRAHAQGHHAAEAAFRAALAEHRDEDALRVEIEQGLAWTVHSLSSGAEARVHARIAYELADRLGDPSTTAGALSYLALLESLTGNGVELDEAARASELGHKPSWSQILGRTDWVHALLLQWSGALVDARGRFEALLERAVAHGDEHALPANLFQLARIELLLGAWPDAHRHARECIDATIRSGQVGERPYALTIVAMVDVHLGNVDLARAEIAEARRFADELGVQPAGLEAQAAQGLLELSVGDHAAAVETHSRLAAATQRAGFFEPAVLRYHGDAIEALLVLGRRQEAAAKLAELEVLPGKEDRPWVQLIAARCRGLLRAANGDLSGAQDELHAALALDIEGEVFERARTQLALGAIQRRDKQKRAARDSLVTASDSFARLGASLWVDRAASELERVGGRGTSDALTVTERRVADLIAAGRSYREAADELFISPKTVQWNLSKVYRKLGIRSRAELPARLAREPHDATGE